MALTASEARLMPQKYCKKHGKMYIIDKDFSLCCYPDCFKANVHKMVKNSKIYQHIVSLDAVDDMCSWLQMQLLIELKEKNKPPILNFPWLNLKLQNFYSNELKKGIVPVASLPSKARKEILFYPIEEEILEEIDNINLANTSWKNINDNTERQLVAKSYFVEVEELCGSVMLAYLLQELTIQDVARIQKLSLQNTRKWINSNLTLLRKQIKR